MVLQSNVARGELGDEAQVSEQISLSGTEYGGFPLPLEGLNLRLPWVGNDSLIGFTTCEMSVLEPTGRGPQGCPAPSRAGPESRVRAEVAFGPKVVPEEATAQVFYAPGGTLLIFVFGHEPVLFEMIIKGLLQPDVAPYSTALHLEVPLVETVPGAQDASLEQLTINLYSGTRTEATPPLLALPKVCQTALLPTLGEALLKGATATASATAPCLAAIASAPVLGRSQGVAVVSGRVLVRRPGSASFIPLEGSSSVPDGSEIEASAGRVAVTAATPDGVSQSAEAFGGRFLVHQPSGGKGETKLALTAPLAGCRKADGLGRAATVTPAHHRPARHLWVSERGGKWGTQGRYVSTSVEGTSWLTTDTCGSSTVYVSRGRVVVRNLVSHRNTLLRSGQSLTVRGRPR